MITFKVGILGAGNIAEKIADTLVKLDGFDCYAIASRDIEKANAFGDKYGIEKRYGSYEELANDPEVELIYIATPHSHHAEQAKMCINAGKPVLVEKAFSHNSKAAAEVISLAREKNIFCGEAMWLRYIPMMRLTRDLIAKHVIGDVRFITANLGYDLRKKERIVKPELAGGALLDIGVYPMNAIVMLMGSAPISFASSCSKLSTGVDAVDIINMNFQNGKMATAFSTIMYNSDNNCMIYGTTGHIEIDNINCPEAIRIYNTAGEMLQEIFPPENQISGYEYEFISARKAIICGNIEPEEMHHIDTLNMMKIYDMLRKAWKVNYPLYGEEAPVANA